MGVHKELPPNVELLKSFNEGIEIEFDVVEHVYNYKGKILKSASPFVKEYEIEFDSARMSGTCSRKWGIDQDDILNLWDSNGLAASGFGTAIHAVLEHYYKNEKLGAKIQKAAGKDKNAAMPNHPFLQELITSLNVIRQSGESFQEACVSCHKKGLAGQIDDLLILDRKKKTCRIRDYKITFDILVENKELKAPFAFLGSNKLAKNFLQLSFYAFLLELSGWKVEGIDIFNWCDGWKKYSLEGNDFKKAIALISSKHL
jgi:hypothetical protein